MQRSLSPKVDTYDPATHRGLRIEGGAGFIGAWRHMTYHEVIAQDRQLERAASRAASEPQRHRDTEDDPPRGRGSRTSPGSVSRCLCGDSDPRRALPVARMDRIGRMA